MKAITICQPYAALITAPAGRLAAIGHTPKRVENRTWATHYRGPLAIHAGQSRRFLANCEPPLPADLLHFGAVVAVAELVDCLPLAAIWDPLPENRLWLRSHVHCEGPWLWVLERVEPLRSPVPIAGKQGLWDFDAVQ